MSGATVAWFPEAERKEALYAMSWCAKKWRHSIKHMRGQGRDDEADTLSDRLDRLDAARLKFHGLTTPQETEVAS